MFKAIAIACQLVGGQADYSACEVKYSTNFFATEEDCQYFIDNAGAPEGYVIVAPVCVVTGEPV